MMNERIEKALMTVGCQFRHDEEYGQVLENFTLRDAEKFAELIIKECVEQGKQVQSQTVSNGSKDYNEGREMGIEVFMNQIKKHFGVE